MKTKAKKAMSTSCFSVPFVTSSPSLFSSELPLLSSFRWCCTYTSLLPFTFLTSFNSENYLLDPISACLGSGSMCFLGGLCLLLPACFLFATEFRSVLYGLSSAGWIKIELQHVTSI